MNNEYLILDNKHRRILDVIIFGLLFFITLYFLYKLSFISPQYGVVTVTENIQPLLFFLSPILGVIFLISIINLSPKIGYLKLTPQFVEWKGIYQYGKYKWEDIDEIYINKFGFLLMSLKVNSESEKQFAHNNRGNISGIKVTSLMKVFGGGKININPPGTYGLPKKELEKLLNNWKYKYDNNIESGLSKNIEIDNKLYYSSLSKAISLYQKLIYLLIIIMLLVLCIFFNNYLETIIQKENKLRIEKENCMKNIGNQWINNKCKEFNPDDFPTFNYRN